MEQDRKIGQKIKIAVIATHQIGIRTKNVQPENQCVTIAKKDTSRTHVCSNTENNQKFKKNTELKQTVESDTDKSTTIITKIEDIIDRRNHITVKIKIDGTQKKFIVDTGSPVTILPSDKDQ